MSRHFYLIVQREFVIKWLYWHNDHRQVMYACLENPKDYVVRKSLRMTKDK